MGDELTSDPVLDPPGLEGPRTTPTSVIVPLNFATSVTMSTSAWTIGTMTRDVIAASEKPERTCSCTTLLEACERHCTWVTPASGIAL